MAALVARLKHASFDLTAVSTPHLLAAALAVAAGLWALLLLAMAL